MCERGKDIVALKCTGMKSIEYRWSISAKQKRVTMIKSAEHLHPNTIEFLK